MRTTEVIGTSLRALDHRSGTPVLLIHGWPDSAYLRRNQIPFLAPHVYRVIVPGMRGFGARTARRRWPTTRCPRGWHVARILDGLDVEAAGRSMSR